MTHSFSSFPSSLYLVGKQSRVVYIVAISLLALRFKKVHPGLRIPSSTEGSKYIPLTCLLLYPTYPHKHQTKMPSLLRFRSSSPRRSRSRSNSHCYTTPSTPSPEIFPQKLPVSEKESDAECWERMLALQREYHCYNSARLEAAVEALENGVALEKVAVRKL